MTDDAGDRLASDRDARRCAGAPMLRAHARILRARSVLEVETPALVNAPVTDVHISAASRAHRRRTPRLLPAHLARVRDEAAARRGQRRHLPDVPRVPRRRARPPAQSRVHDDRVVPARASTLEELMDEVERAGARRAARRRGSSTAPSSSRIAKRCSARGLDPLRRRHADAARRGAERRRRRCLRDVARDATSCSICSWRTQVGPALGRERAHLRASLSRVAGGAGAARSRRSARRAALRAVHRGIELANGYHELATAASSARASSTILARARARGLPASCRSTAPAGRAGAGLPDCAGVALGFDRVLMLATARGTSTKCWPFPWSAPDDDARQRRRYDFEQRRRGLYASWRATCARCSQASAT